MSFLTSLFALNISDFPHNASGSPLYSSSWAFSRIFGITAAIAVPLIAVAVFVNEVRDFFTALFGGVADKDSLSPAQQRGSRARASVKALLRLDRTLPLTETKQKAKGRS